MDTSVIFVLMPVKDYYRTLNVPAQASIEEIKKAYRLLAQQYHPDKNNNDPYSIAYFSEIKEAYETLTNPFKKDIYLQERWYNRATGNKRSREVITPVTILKEVLEFEKYTSKMDVFRMDKERLFSYINELLSEETISQLQQFNEPEINQQIVLTMLKPVRLLKSEKALLLTERLSKITTGNNKIHLLISDTIRKIQREEKWKKYEWVFVLLITLVILLLIRFG